MPEQERLIENLGHLRSALEVNEGDAAERVRLAIRITDDLEGQGIYSVGLESFVHSPDSADGRFLIAAIDRILRRLAAKDVSLPLPPSQHG